MKANRIITFLMAFAAAMSTFAQEQSPEDLTVYQYNEAWLDSIPYLMEHVRNKEAWANMNLARCYRYGIGVDKCFTNAMMYYFMTNAEEQELATKAYEADPTDEFGMMNHLLENLEKGRLTVEEASALIDGYPDPKPSWMVRMKTIFDHRNDEDLEGYIKSTTDWDNFTGDEIMAAIGCLMTLRPETPLPQSRPATPELLNHLALIAGKLPMFYMITGDKYWNLYKDSPDNEEAMKEAFEMYHKAYLHGLLDMGGAIAVLDYSDVKPLYAGFPFTQAELAHLDGLYSPELRQHLHTPAVEEEVVIEEVVVEEEAE